MQDVSNFEIHYFLNDNSHSMDAFVRHKCERELLKIAETLIESFGGNIDVLSELPLEGGRIDLWKFMKKNGIQLNLSLVAIGIITQILVGIMTRPPAKSEDERKNDFFDAKIKERQYIEMLNKADSGTLNNEEFEFLQNYYNQSPKVNKHRSNYYQFLKGYDNVSGITTTSYSDDKTPLIKGEVLRQDFKKFILESNDLPDQIIDKALIEVISPVLKTGKYKWRGVYNDNIITFNMKDYDFRNSVLKGETIFHSGFYLECELIIKRKISEEGTIENSDYTVKTVLSKINSEGVMENISNKKKLRKKKGKSGGQYGMFDNES